MKDAKVEDSEHRLDEVIEIYDARRKAIGIPDPKNPLQFFLMTLEMLEDLRLLSGDNTMDVPPEVDILSPLCQHFFGEFTTWPNISNQGRLIMAIFTDHIANAEGLESLVNRPAWDLSNRQHKILDAAMEIKANNPKWKQENISVELESIAALDWTESSPQKGSGSTARRELQRINQKMMSALQWKSTPIEVRLKYEDCIRKLFRNSAKKLAED